jgi:LysR family positive regulator for ilvC
MHLSPSALSRQIQKLEEDIGHPLFIRDNRSVELTSAAKQLIPVAMNICSEWNGYKTHSNIVNNALKGQLKLFCSVTASYSHLPQLLNDFKVNYPHIDIKLSTGDPAQAIEKIESSDADIAISAIPEKISNKLAFEIISEIPLSVIAPTGNNQFIGDINKENTNWNSLPFILPESGTARNRANQWFKEQKIKPTIYAQVSGHEAIVSMVALGCGIGIAPDVVINNSPVKDKIQRLNTTPIAPFKLGLCCKKSKLNDPVVQALWQIAENTFI